MPCKCSGVKYEKCSCKYLATACPLSRDSSKATYVVLTQDNGDFKFRKAENKKQRHEEQGFLARLLEDIYEKCAAYNLRYCPLRSYSSKGRLQLTIRDLVLLTCFLLANFVVFLTIFVRITTDVLCLLFETIKLVKRYLSSAKKKSSPIYQYHASIRRRSLLNNNIKKHYS